MGGRIKDFSCHAFMYWLVVHNLQKMNYHTKTHIYVNSTTIYATLCCTSHCTLRTWLNKITIKVIRIKTKPTIPMKMIWWLFTCSQQHMHIPPSHEMHIQLHIIYNVPKTLCPKTQNVQYITSHQCKMISLQIWLW